ncbi:MAG: tRNA-uridine aminocarboxypropyltransferase [Planctomycetota bacterium]
MTTNQPVSEDSGTTAVDAGGVSVESGVDRGDAATAPVYRQRCYRCYRPVQLCFCDVIPDINNKIDVLIIQDRREHFHAFNTARIVDAALSRSQLVVGRQEELIKRTLPLKPGAGVLFPGPEAKLISELAPEERPEQLVVLDGTWHHAKQLFRKLPPLQNLPRYRIDPEQPGNYRIRKEPNEKALSTIEATVEAMRALEPETEGWDELINAFTIMIDRQIAHPKSQYGVRFNTKRFGTPFNIPSAIVHRFDDLIVAYGESAAVHWRESCRSEEAVNARRAPVFWVARKMGTGEVFCCAIKSKTTGCVEVDGDWKVGEDLQRHLELEPSHFADALSHEQFRIRWQAFVGAESTIAVYNQSSLEMLRYVDADFSPSIILKCIDLETGRRNGSLKKMIDYHGLVPAPPEAPGRAGRRLAGAVELVHYFKSIVDSFNEDSKAANTDEA